MFLRVCSKDSTLQLSLSLCGGGGQTGTVRFTSVYAACMFSVYTLFSLCNVLRCLRSLHRKLAQASLSAPLSDDSGLGGVASLASLPVTASAASAAPQLNTEHKGIAAAKVCVLVFCMHVRVFVRASWGLLFYRF